MGCATKYSDRPYKQASPFCLRIQAFDLICRYDVDLWLSVAKFDCAAYADDFPLNQGKSLIGRYRGAGRNETSKRLIGEFCSKIDKSGTSGLVVTRQPGRTPRPFCRPYSTASESLITTGLSARAASRRENAENYE
jgi:hypothetical protein